MSTNLSKTLRLPLRLLAVLLVVAVAWMLRARAVDQLPIDYDEDDYLRAGQEYAALVRSGDWAGFLETNYRPEHPPLDKIVFGLAVLTQPETELLPDRPTSSGPASSLPSGQLRAARTTSAVSGTLEVLLLALVDPLGALFLGIHTFTIKYTSQVMLEGLPALTSLAAVLAYVRWKKINQDANRSPKSLDFGQPATGVAGIWSKVKYGWLVVSAILLGLTAASKYLYAVVGVAILIDWILNTEHVSLITRSSAKRLLPILAWGLLALAFFFIANPYLWPDPIGRLQESLFYHAGYTTGAAEVQQAGFPFWQPFVWLNMSVPWHPGVFIVALDGLIFLFSFFGLKRLWQRQRVYALWLAAALLFLLLWPTKWPQYVLVLTAPLGLAAAEGLRALVVEPVKAWRTRRGGARTRVRPRFETRKALPWLVPGLVAFALLTLFPLVYQLAMSLTDFSGSAIRDGLTGGVWREAWGGLSGQIEPRPVTSIPFAPSDRQVHYIGPILYLPVLGYLGQSGVLVFEVLWTVLTVGLQAALGIGVALLLWQRGLKGRSGWRALFVLPWAVPETVGAIMWMGIFQPRFGALSLAAGDTFATRLDFPQPLQNLLDWQNNPTVALLVLLIPAVWYGFPFLLLAASAGLKMVPDDVFDAAALDGANGWQTFRHVTWPLLMPLVMPAVIVRAIFAFNQFYLFQVFVPYGGPGAVTTLAQVSYSLLGDGNQYALSAALNVLTMLILVVFVGIFNRWSRAGEGVTYA